MRSVDTQRALVGVLAALGLSASSSAAIVTLRDGNASSQINTSTQDGMFNWVIDGVSHLAQQWFWFRVGNNAERSIDSLTQTGMSVTDTNPFTDTRADRLSLRYEGGGVRIEPSFVLRGGSAGSGSSNIAEQIRITNLTASSMALTFFQYSDFNLNGTALDSSVFIVGNDAFQSDGPFTLTETVVTPFAQNWEANAVPITKARLNDGVADNLNGNAGPVGPGDLSWAFQWNFTIPAGKSVLISKDKRIVPTPGAVMLVGVAGLLGLRRRRN